MLNSIIPIFTFLFVFSITWIVKTTIIFLSAFLSTPPKTFELSRLEVFYHGLMISYIITFLIYI